MALGTQEHDTGLAEREKLVQSRWHGRRSSESAPRPEKISSASPRDSFAFRDHSFSCSLTTTAVITAACTKMATARAVADQASVRRDKAPQELRDAVAEVEPPAVARCLHLHGIDCGEQPLPRARRWRTERLIGWIVSTSSPRIISVCRASSRSPASACSTRLASGPQLPAACHGSRASIP
jgi:hypothetical protein